MNSSSYDAKPDGKGFNDAAIESAYGETSSLPERELPMWKLVVAALPWVGIQSIWQTEFGLITPIMEGLGLSSFWATNIWIFGPITGFITAPIVGAFSDSCRSRFGRRRPFLVGGLLTLVTISMLFAGARHIFPSGAVLPISFILAVLIDVTINIIQTPLRALVSDVAPKSQQATGQLLSSFFQGCGGLLGYGLMKVMYHNEDDLLKLFGTVMAINVFFILLTCFIVKEAINNSAQMSSLSEPFVTVFKAIRHMDMRLGVVAAVQFFSWAALFAWWPTGSTWFGINVFGGCNGPQCTPEGQALFNDAMGHYSMSGVYANVLQIVYSMALASLVTFGILQRTRFIYAGSLAVGAVIMLLSKFGPQTLGMAYAVAILISVPISAINAFPFAIVGKYSQEDEGNLAVGVQMGILNLFICTPQLIVTFIIAGMREGLGQEGLPWALVMAGGCFAVAGAIALMIREVVAKN